MWRLGGAAPQLQLLQQGQRSSAAAGQQGAGSKGCDEWVEATHSCGRKQQGACGQVLGHPPTALYTQSPLAH